MSMDDTGLLVLDLLLFTGLVCLTLGHVLASRDHRLRWGSRPRQVKGPDGGWIDDPDGGRVDTFYLLPRRTGHLISGVGYLAFGCFWMGQVDHYLQIEDVVNAAFAAGALPFFAYLAYHEYLSYQWDEVYSPLRWLGATVVIAGGIYFAVDRVPYITGGLVQMVADQSAWVLTYLFDYPTNTGALEYNADNLWFRAGAGHEQVRIELISSKHDYDDAPTTINIVLACTALQSMIIFIGGIICTQVRDTTLQEGDLVPRMEPQKKLFSIELDQWLLLMVSIFCMLVLASYLVPSGEGAVGFLLLGWFIISCLIIYGLTNSRRLRAFLITVPVIYMLNLLRNGIVTWLTYSGTMEFEPAHNYIGKGGSLIALVFLAVATFSILPELHDNILGLFDLPKRKRGQDYPPRTQDDGMYTGVEDEAVDDDVDDDAGGGLKGEREREREKKRDMKTEMDREKKKARGPEGDGTRELAGGLMRDDRADGERDEETGGKREKDERIEDGEAGIDRGAAQKKEPGTDAAPAHDGGTPGSREA